MAEKYDGDLFFVLPAFTPPEDTARLLEVCFEDLKVRRLGFVCENVATSYASGLVTSLTVVCGHSHTTVAALFEGYKVPGCYARRALGMADVDRAVAAQMQSVGVRWRRACVLATCACVVVWLAARLVRGQRR